MPLLSFALAQRPSTFSMQRSLELFYSPPSPLFFFFFSIDYYACVCRLQKWNQSFPPRVQAPSSLNLSACPNHASIDHVAPLTRPKGNVISREGEGRFPEGRFSPFIPSTRILISSMMFGEVIFRQICVR